MNEPKLRFKNDNGKQFPNWEEKRVADVANRVKVGFVGACERYYVGENGIPLYRTGNLQLGKLIEDDMKYVSKEFHIANKKSQLHKGDILVARHGSSGNAVLYNSEKEANCLNIVIIQPNLKTVNPKFMVESINSPNVVKQVSRLKNGSTQVVLNTKDIENLDVNIPSLSEQQKIASLFTELDALIQSAEKELEGYRELKHGMLQKMFPKKGEKVPEIRFPEFTSDWEQRKLGEITIYRNGTGHEEKQSESGKYELINLNSISIDGGLKPSGKFIDEETETLLKDDLVMVLSDVGHGDLLGRVALIPENNRFVLNQRVALLRNKGSVDIQYLFSYINAHQIYFKKEGAGSSQLNISRGSVENFDVLLPHKDEQKKIGSYFANLDNLIQSAEKELDGYKELKKGLLQQMFC